MGLGELRPPARAEHGMGLAAVASGCRQVTRISAKRPSHASVASSPRSHAAIGSRRNLPARRIWPRGRVDRVAAFRRFGSLPCRAVLSLANEAR